MCAGAFQGSTFYGHYYCADLYACHDYSGANVLYPASHNGYGGTQNMQGIESYGDSTIVGCPHGSASASLSATTISTPYGTGWLLRDPGGGQECLRVPDSVAGFGSSCVSTGAASAGRLVAAFVAGPGSSSDEAEVIAVIPAGSGTPTVTYDDGSQAAAPVRNGVLSLTVRGARSVTLRPPDGSSLVISTAPENRGSLFQDRNGLIG